jgi:CRP/FNR family transcriptional regulator
MNTAKEREVCRICDRRDACRRWDLSAEVCERLDDIGEHSGIIPAGHRLWELSEPILAINIVRSGAFKCCRAGDDGHDLVLGFTLPTEVVGVDGMYIGLHKSNAVALEDSRICSFDLARLKPLMSQYPDLSALVLRLVSNTLRHPDLDGHRNPEQRIAAFLINLSRRALRRGEPAAVFGLPMSPKEIGSYLQLPPETVRSVLDRLSDHRQIDLGPGRVHLLAPERLQVLASA